MSPTPTPWSSASGAITCSTSQGSLSIDSSQAIASTRATDPSPSDAAVLAEVVHDEVRMAVAVDVGQHDAFDVGRAMDAMHLPLAAAWARDSHTTARRRCPADSPS